jgi:Ser/Thr protein kinase RdoA (MazF antagonist)
VSAGWVLRYLLGSELISPALLVAGRVQVHEQSVSHATFRVLVDAQPRWFLKRADVARSQGRDLGSEAIVYELARSNPDLQQVMPHCVHVGEAGQLLVLEALPGQQIAAPLPAVLRAYGRAAAQANRAYCAPFGQRPWLLDALDNRWGGYEWLPATCAQLLRRLRGDVATRQGFALARATWQPGRLVHGDLRGANALSEQDDQAGEPCVRLIDWELACCGDPAWDLGSMLADLIAALALASPGADIDQSLQAQACGLLAGYRESAGLSEAEWVQRLERSARLAGVRLLQTVLEMGHLSADDLAQGEAVLLPWTRYLLQQAQAFATELMRPAKL